MKIPAPWKLTSFEVLEAPAASVLFFHNDYEEGKQGGLEFLQEAVRIAANGNLRLSYAPGQWAPLPKHSPRRVTGTGALEVDCIYHLADGEISYTLRLTPQEGALQLTLDLAQGLPPGFEAGFNLELLPAYFYGKPFLMDGMSGLFPRAFTSAVQGKRVEALARGRRLVAAPDSLAVRLEFESQEGELELLDGRGEAQNGWFIVRAPIPAGKNGRVVDWRIVPSIQPDWMRKPVILFSQVGYHPAQTKVAVIELDGHDEGMGEARLVRLDGGGETTVLARRLELWGEYLCFRYARFDFSAAREAGLYRLEYENSRSEAFPIDPAVYQRGVWQPTLEEYFPVQMCHMEVRHGVRVWHGLCHMDDALQAPLNHTHFDGYMQYETTDTPYAPYEHIPCLDRGGWHDAGDYDLAAGSQAGTTLVLALAREAFSLDSDQTRVDTERLRVDMHIPDGQPDILQQIAHGVENLVSGYRATGHSFIGIIENNLDQYAFLGDAAVMTNQRRDPQAGSDDRWAFTNRNTLVEYAVCGALAAGARVLRGWDDGLAGEALDWARKAWAFEQSRAPETRRNCYIGGKWEIHAARAAVELFLTTGEDEFRRAVLERKELYFDNPSALGGVAARAAEALGDAAFDAGLEKSVAEYMRRVDADAARNPFGIAYPAETWREQAPVWGVGWNFLSHAVEYYFLRRRFPGLVRRELIEAVLGYMLGCHPVSNASLVSGVGARSLTEAYGINRADWSFIAGGVVSGPALIRPNYPELQDPYPHLWMQKEYVMGGAATYLFTVLAVEQQLNESDG